MSSNKDESNLIVIYSGNPVEAEIVKDILIQNDIAANLNNELMGSIAPFHASGGGVSPVGVMIFEKDKEDALTLIKEFTKESKTI